MPDSDGQVHGVEEKRQGNNDENNPVVAADGQSLQTFRRAVAVSIHAVSPNPKKSQVRVCANLAGGYC
jgi:hypothetical protein